MMLCFDMAWRLFIVMMLIDDFAGLQGVERSAQSARLSHFLHLSLLLCLFLLYIQIEVNSSQTCVCHALFNLHFLRFSLSLYHLHAARKLGQCFLLHCTRVFGALFDIQSRADPFGITLAREILQQKSLTICLFLRNCSSNCALSSHTSVLQSLWRVIKLKLVPSFSIATQDTSPA